MSIANVDQFDNVAEELRLWALWRLGGDEDAKLSLFKLYQPFARAVSAKLYAKRIHDEIEFDEYQQFANVALIESMDRYQYDRGVKFTSYAYPRISGAVLTGLDRLTEKQQQIALRRRLQSDRLTLQDEISYQGKSDIDQLLGHLAEIGIGLAIGAMLEGSGMVTSDDEWQSDQNYQRVELKQFSARLRYLLTELTERERQVIQQHYLQGKNFDDISLELGLTKGRISQLHAKGLMRLRTVISMDIKTNVAW